MKKVVLSVIALVGAFSLMFAILAYPNLQVRQGDGIIKTVDIYQEINIVYPGSITGSSSAHTGFCVFYNSTTYQYLIQMPTAAILSSDYNISISDGEILSNVDLLVPLVVRLNDNYYGGYFSTPWATEKLYNLVYSDLTVDISRSGNTVTYSNVRFNGYYVDFSSSSMIKLITFVIDAQKEAKADAPELQKPVLLDTDNTLEAIKNGFTYLGDWISYSINYIKFIYAYFEIPIDLYFIGE